MSTDWIHQSNRQKNWQAGEEALTSAGRGNTSFRLTVNEFARWEHDGCSDIFYRLKRLLNYLAGPRGDLTDVAKAYRKSVSTYILHNTPVVTDLAGLAKPNEQMQWHKLKWS